MSTPARIVHVDDSRAVLGQDLRKQPGLGVEIGLEGLVIIQMVLREIGKAGSLQDHTVQTALVQPVRGGLHRSVGNAVLRRKVQSAVQSDRLGGGVMELGGPGPFNTRGAKVHGLQLQLGPDLAHKSRH